MQAVALDAGRLVGIGDARSIGLGRFEVLALEVNDDAQ
jgi:CRISPR/Cas system endoribonuclease Cas6 (RAMP superfamily)